MTRDSSVVPCNVAIPLVFSATVEPELDSVQECTFL